jgi:tetratricopeptide (TPR) repeat protein
VAANLAMFDADVDAAADQAAVALELSRRLGYRRGEASALRTLGAVAVAREQISDGEELHRRALAISRDLADSWGTGFSLTNVANLEALHGRLGAAGELYEESLAIRRAKGDAWGLTWTLFRLGTLRTWEARFDDARGLLEEGLALAEGLRYGAGTVLSLLGLGDAAHLRGDQPTARNYYLEASAKARELEDQAGIVLSAVGLANVAVASGDLSEAGDWLASQDVTRAPGTLSISAAVGRCRARLAHARGAHQAARELHLQVLFLCERMHDVRGMIDQLEELAVLADEGGDRSLAASLLASAEATRAAIGAPVPPLHAQARAALAGIEQDDGVLAARAAGAARTLGEAVALARSAASGTEDA